MIADDVVAWRHHLHRHPELGFEERETAAFVAARLRAFGLNVTEGIAGTGVVGVLTGSRGAGRTIAFRADIDALPIVEGGSVAHRSIREGRMHACGHDGHIAMLLGAARALADKPDFAGRLCFIFQPAEEGLAGGRAMVETGLFDRFSIDEVYGLHNWPELVAGQIAVRPGPMMAANDYVHITLRGIGGHAALPDTCTDPVVAAAQLVIALQSIVSRNARPTDPLVISVTRINAGDADNVIPQSATLSGTVRTFSTAMRDLAERRIREIAIGIGAAMGVAVDLTYDRRYPATVNSAPEAAHAARAAAVAVGQANVRTDLPPSMGSEDFAFMLQARPGAYVWLGQGADGGHMVHSPFYDFNDAVIPTGIAYWCALAAERLGA